MSGGGMEWAYRMIAKHQPDPLGALVLLHLGWRDAASQRTDRGIALALGQHRSSIRKATAKLAALFVIERRSDQWVACETVAIVEGRADAPRPSADARDDVPEVGHSVARKAVSAGVGHSVARGGPLSGPGLGHSVARPSMRKERLSENARGKVAPAAAAASSRIETAAAAPVVGEGLSNLQRARLLAGQSVLVSGRMVLPGSQEAESLCLLLRADAGKAVARGRF